ncbi:MAG: hypothetical protein HGA63_00110 [Syntrophobacteraceae bacterium]|nr:hypothetical protein [Syntrophobacteraceae bacterium]
MRQSSRLSVAAGILMGFSVFGLLLATQGMLSKEEPFFSWYYCFAWWSYILFMESFLYLRGGFSCLLGDTRTFLMRLPLSVTIWLIFEAFNFRLNNWHYTEIVKEIDLRWIGYALSFATVLPGIFVTQRVLEHLGIARDVRCARLQHPQHLYKLFFFAGGLLLFGPLLWPKVLFPCVWLGFVFLLEPVNHRWGGDSLLSDLERGSPRRIFILLLAGLWCGLLWELWDFWAGSKWVYTVPIFGFLKVFEMPLLGFLGFPPFALECYVMASFFFVILVRAREKLTPSRFAQLCAVAGVVVLLFWGAVFWGIDRFTVVGFQP